MSQKLKKKERYLETFFLKEEGVKKTKSGLAHKILKAEVETFQNPQTFVEESPLPWDS